MTPAQRLFGEGHRRAYDWSLGLAIVFSVIHLIALPIVVTPDGYQYLFLGEITLEPGYFNRFDYVRGPLFPLMLKLAGLLAGRQGDSVVLVNVLLTVGSVLIVGTLVRRFAGNIAAAIAVLVCIANPVTIAYAHAILQQAGIGFFVCLVVAVQIRRIRNRADLLLIQPLLIVLTVSLGYYFAPNLRVLIVPAVLIHFYQVFRWFVDEEGAAGRGKAIQLAIVQVIGILIVSHMLQLPWRMVLDAHGGDHREGVLSFGLMNQAIPDPDTSGYLGEWRELYRATVENASAEGRFPLSGMVDQPKFYHLHSALMTAADMNKDTAGTVFLEIIAENPGRYVQGVTRSFLHLIGIPSRRSENQWVAALTYSPQFKHGGFTEEPKLLVDLLMPAYEQRKGTWAASSTLRKGVEPARWLAFFGWLATMANLLVGLSRRRIDLIVVSLPPLTFLGSFCLLLLSIDRYAAPLMPLAFLNLVVAGRAIWLWVAASWTAKVRRYMHG